MKILFVTTEGKTKELYTGTPNSDIRILCTVHCGRNVSKTKALMWYYSPTKNKLIYMIFGFLVNMENTIAIYFYSTPWTLFTQKWCVAPEFFVLISSHWVHRFNAWDMAVPGLYIPWVKLLCLNLWLQQPATFPMFDQSLQFME